MKLAAVGSNCIDFYNNIENGKAYPGGSPVNVAVYTVRLGGEASYTGPVGDDVYGKIMQEAIAAKGDFIQTHDMVVCDLWGKVEGQFRALKARGIPTAFDCATRPEDEASRIAMPYTDYLFFSSDDGDTPALRDQMKGYHSRGPKLVIALLGEHGSLCYDGSEFHKFGIVPCEHLVDSMGAGDSYIAGFLYGIVEGLPIDEAMQKGAANATETLKYFGAW